MLLRRRGGRDACHDHALDRRRAEEPRRSHGGEALERVDGDDRRAGREQAAERARAVDPAPSRRATSFAENPSRCSGASIESRPAPPK